MNARKHERHRIHIEELAGSFSLYAGDTQFQYMRMNDVSTAGAGLLLSQPLAVGTPVRLTFSAGDWAVSVDGSIIWCKRQTLPLGTSQLQENFRLGIQFLGENNDRNIMFFQASKSSLKKFH